MEVASGQAAPEHSADIVNLQVHPFEPRRNPVPSFRRGLAASGNVVLGAAEFEVFFFTSLPQAEAGVFTHGLVQPIARAARDVLFDDQRLVQQ
ncbi:MAG: hypothetical protein E6I75_28140 [Chloroflexi bacterium]|nr:MAG: hypothetical protein E6I75_28140 [Chloroflexota bacterium]